jgi:hypothetical protein
MTEQQLKHILIKSKLTLSEINPIIFNIENIEVNDNTNLNICIHKINGDMLVFNNVSYDITFNELAHKIYDVITANNIVFVLDGQVFDLIHFNEHVIKNKFRTS